MVETRDLLGGGRAMNRYYIEVRYRALIDGPAALDQATDDLMDALIDQPDLVDPDIGVDLARSTVDVCTMVDADDEPDALSKVLGAVHSALQRADGPTGRGFERDTSTVRPAALAGT